MVTEFIFIYFIKLIHRIIPKVLSKDDNVFDETPMKNEYKTIWCNIIQGSVCFSYDVADGLNFYLK